MNWLVLLYHEGPHYCNKSVIYTKSYYIKHQYSYNNMSLNSVTVSYTETLAYSTKFTEIFSQC